LSRLYRSVLQALALVLVCCASAQAHDVSPRYLTHVSAISPHPKGMSIQVLGRDNQLFLHNQSGRTIFIGGYNGDQYARLEGDGTVSVNTNSPAYYLNEDRFGTTPVPKNVTGRGAPKWKLVSKTGRFIWHDHRMHWMAHSVPPQVKNPDKRTKIFNWKIPIAVSGQKGDIAGTLFWTPKPAAPKGLLIGGTVVIVLLCVAALIAARRRRRDFADDDEGSPRASATEAW
jgi:hypothetical protein